MTYDFTRTVTDADDSLIAGVLSILRDDGILQELVILDADDPLLLDLGQKALAGAGLVTTVQGPEVREELGAMLVAEVRVLVEENLRQNRGPVGTGTSGRCWAKRMWAALRGQCPSEHWTRLVNLRLTEVTSSEEVISWLLTAETRSGSESQSEPGD